MSSSTILTLGVDEAGRGAVLGPLVVAACALSTEQRSLLSRAGVADSKGFGPPSRAQARRAQLSELIEERARWCDVVIASPRRVDESVRRGQLNELERAMARELLDRAPAGCRILLDGQRVFGPLCRQYARATALDRADSREVAVAAASILAKTRRDELLAKVLARYEPELGPIRGGGYPNVATARFIEACVAKTGSLPPEVRLSWRWPPLMRHTTARQRGEDPSLPFT